MTSKRFFLLSITLGACQGASLCSSPSATVSKTTPVQVFFGAVKSLDSRRMPYIIVHYPEVIDAKNDSQDTMLHRLSLHTNRALTV